MADDNTTSPTAPTLQNVILQRMRRRDFLFYAAVFATSLAVRSPLGAASTQATPLPNGGIEPGPSTLANPSSLTFTELPKADRGPDHRVAAGYHAAVLVRWGDPILATAPAWSPTTQSPEAQSLQFGYNNDFIAYLPLPKGSTASDHGLLCVNHEYTSAGQMVPRTGPGALSPADLNALEMAAHGHTVVEIHQSAGQWQTVPDGRYNRRLTAHTPIILRGPAAGHARLRTAADPSGTTVLGTLNNCAGGVTPWGTVLIAEENFHKYFLGNPETHPYPASARRYGLGKPDYPWHATEARFDQATEPNEANRFGWIVELDPYDPTSTPIKRTALGRFRHEAATCAVNVDGKIVIYSGDDTEYEHLYRFVSRDAYDPANPDPHLLDHGTLYAARFLADGTLTWLPLRHGEGPLTPENGFASQADVLIDARLAAGRLQATPMDRPEDVEANPTTGRVYVMLTNNKARKASGVANPLAPNTDGHILELIPPGGDQPDHASDAFTWNVFLTAGPPPTAVVAAAAPGAADAAGSEKSATPRLTAGHYHPAISDAGWFSAPDNCAFDSRGRLWIATDMAGQQAAYSMADGIWATDTVGDGRALTRLFYAGPLGAELCGPAFTPDGRTLFVSIQHPGEGSPYNAPTTRWPDFSLTTPPRPSVVAITHLGGAPIGT